MGSRTLIQKFEIKFFHFLAGPGCSAQEFEAGAYGWVVIEASDIDDHAEFFPSIFQNQLFQHVLELHTMQWVVRLGRCSVFAHFDDLNVSTELDGMFKDQDPLPSTHAPFCLYCSIFA
jgi:hypothetical protein